MCIIILPKYHLLLAKYSVTPIIKTHPENYKKNVNKQNRVKIRERQIVFVSNIFCFFLHAGLNVKTFCFARRTCFNESSQATECIFYALFKEHFWYLCFMCRCQYRKNMIKMFVYLWEVWVYPREKLLVIFAAGSVRTNIVYKLLCAFFCTFFA